MDGKAFKMAVDALVKEKGISPEVIFDAMELALVSGYKKNYDSLSNVRVPIDQETGDIKVFSFKTVVEDDYEKREDKEEKRYLDSLEELEEYDEKLQELKEELSEKINSSDEKIAESAKEKLENFELTKPEVIKPFVYDERIHITLKEANEQVQGIKLGETIEKEVTPKDFGRVAASTAKQVVVQKVREAEREVIIAEFESKENEMISGLVAMEDERNYYIHLGRAQGILPKTEIIPGEKIQMGNNIKVYVTKVDNTPKGPLILLSRNHYGFVKRLFELEIPEVNEGIVLVYSVAREAGIRTKVAVYSENPRVDAVGACIGEGGTRINRIIKELNGEKIDIIEYNEDISKFVENALSPAKNVTVLSSKEDDNDVIVIVDDENLALAIGRGGLNVKLAARLTRRKIDIKNSEEAKKMGINILN